jgi:pimeloyl-ACP methyl ester carboxylesterase
MGTSFSTSVDGTRIAYDVTGSGRGNSRALMLLHGAVKTRRDWHKVGYVERLKDDFTVITVDVRGTGDSDHLYDISDYAIEKICEDLYAVADACGADKFAVWGFSFAGLPAGGIGKTTPAVRVVGLFPGHAGLARRQTGRRQLPGDAAGRHKEQARDGVGANQPRLAGRRQRVCGGR